ncbi:MAG: hypothetical protein C0169_03975 [Thermodesulfobacterium geofontis]|uniref:Uncharacterized protein n=1 Tax=Thermodesulfobacterium geofontis TaxID=1295609 RepID=A0A2N7QEP2_9BACT|nr:MAG: hypothetical protein C0169_03975 [Thermodesulfobacterium geofontis]
MKCQKCNYIFSEEIKICPKCGADMGMVLEKLGYFPPSASRAFLTIDDFKEKYPFERVETEGEAKERKEEIEFTYEDK